MSHFLTERVRRYIFYDVVVSTSNSIGENSVSERIAVDEPKPNAENPDIAQMLSRLNDLETAVAAKLAEVSKNKEELEEATRTVDAAVKSSACDQIRKQLEAETDTARRDDLLGRLKTVEQMVQQSEMMHSALEVYDAKVTELLENLKRFREKVAAVADEVKAAAAKQKAAATGTPPE